jgi:hypothetical protein
VQIFIHRGEAEALNSSLAVLVPVFMVTFRPPLWRRRKPSKDELLQQEYPVTDQRIIINSIQALIISNQHNRDPCFLNTQALFTGASAQ